MSRTMKVALGLGLGVYFVFLVISRTPAEWATYLVTKNSPMIQLYGVSGTVWKGKVAKATVNLAGSGIDLGEVRWKLKAARLLILSACADIESTMLSSAICRSVTGSTSVSNLRLDVPASLANPFVREANFNGQTSLNLTSGAFNDQGVVHDLNGNFSWRGLQAQVEGRWFSMGDFGADLAADGAGGINASIFDLQSPVQVKLNANVGVGKPYSIEGTVVPSDAAPPELNDALSIFAVPLETGGFQVAYPFK